MTKQKCLNCGTEFDGLANSDCAGCTRYIPGICNGKANNSYCQDCCVKLGKYMI